MQITNCITVEICLTFCPRLFPFDREFKFHDNILHSNLISSSLRKLVLYSSSSSSSSKLVLYTVELQWLEH